MRNGKTPSEKIFNYNPRLPMNLVEPNQPILFQRFQLNRPPVFVPGTVVSTSGKSLVNIKDSSDAPHTRHMDQIKFDDRPTEDSRPISPEKETSLSAASPSPPLMEPNDSPEFEGEIRRYPQRTRRPPDFYGLGKM